MLAPKCSQESNRVANILMNLGAAILIIRYTIRKLITNNQTFLSVFSAGVLPNSPNNVARFPFLFIFMYRIGRQADRQTTTN